MKGKKLIGRAVFIVITVLLLYGIYYCWISFPVATGYGSKVFCSAVFVSGRNENDVKSQELAFFPLTLADYEVDYKDSSVTCSLFGFARRKAIFRTGLGSTVVNEFSEEEIRSQPIQRAVRPSFTSDTVPWPMGNKLIGSLPSTIDSTIVETAVNKLFVETDTTNPNRTRAVIVVYDNQMVAEKYAPGFTSNTRLTGWSMTKSVFSALTGVLVMQGKLDIDAPAPVQEWSDTKDPRHPITVRHLLQQTSGLKFEEVYSKSSNATRMLCQKGDMAAYAASLPLKYPPGQHFHYSSGNTNILSRIIRRTIGEGDYHTFPYKQLFYKLGMYNTLLEPDASGTFVGSSYCYATARDWARLGLLYLNNGFYNGEQILPADWVEQSTTPSSAAQQGQYGFKWWLNAGEKGKPENRVFPTLPADLFYADGFEGQNIFIIPSKKLVVVRLGLTRKSQYGEVELLEQLMKAIP